MPFGPVSYLQESKEGFQVKLRSNRCAGANFVLSSDTSITGKVFGTNGQPMAHVCLERTSTEVKTASSYFRIFDCTKEKSRYELKEVPPGK